MKDMVLISSWAPPSGPTDPPSHLRCFQVHLWSPVTLNPLHLVCQVWHTENHSGTQQNQIYVIKECSTTSSNAYSRLANSLLTSHKFLGSPPSPSSAPSSIGASPWAPTALVESPSGVQRIRAKAINAEPESQARSKGLALMDGEVRTFWRSWTYVIL